MIACAEPMIPELPSLADAPWLAWPSTRAVLSALAMHGFEARIVGGSVRNELLGLPVADIDIATPARPEAVVQACAAAGLVAVPTGLEHGTVTVVAHRTAIEVTSLRRDVLTDGRRATVAFTSDWEEDARRRDFTMNALYCDGSGRLFDPVGGYRDLVARRVCFIGNADERIAEDYLRILRFFRFHASYASGDPDPLALAACARGLPGISRLSAERIRGELVKLLVAPRAVEAIRSMQDVGLLTVVLGAAPRPGVMNAVADFEARLRMPADAMLRLSALAVAVVEDIDRLATRLRLSGEERRSLIVIDHGMPRRLGRIDMRQARRLVYDNGAAMSRRFAAGLYAVDRGRQDEARTLVSTADTWTPPRLPAAGADVVAAGIAPGPGIGRILHRLERWWVEHDFPDEAATRTELARLIEADFRSSSSE